MGQLTFATVVSEGLLKAGNDSLTTRAGVWLNAWLRSQYAAWPWPFLQRRITGVALAAGTSSLSIGAGSSGVTLEIKRILDPLWLYNSAYTAKGRPRIRQLIDGEMSRDETINDFTNSRGQPTEFKVRADTSTWGKWSLIPTPVPDAAYLLGIDYIVQPANISTTSDVPLYPNDRTMIQAVCVEALQYMQRYDAYSAELQILSKMVVDDRVKYGEVTGTNDVLTLDSNVFR